MPRDEMQEKILEKFHSIQGNKDEPVWVSGKQVTEIINGNPSSIRMALLLLYENGELIRERRKGRGKKGRTGQSAWYALNNGEKKPVVKPSPPKKRRKRKARLHDEWPW